MVNLVPARINAVFPIDPQIVLKNYIRQNWGTGNITGLPASDSVGMDTKWGAPNMLNKEQAILVEKMPKHIEAQVLGGSRSTYVDSYRVQIYCRGHSARNNKYLMEQEIERIINGDSKAIQTVNNTATGIDWAWCSDFNEILVQNDAKVAQGTIGFGIDSTAARSSAIVEFHYDKQSI